MRRWTGFSPSRTSGRARETMTDIEYSRKERSISSWISMGSMKPDTASSVPTPLPPLPLSSRAAIPFSFLRTFNLPVDTATGPPAISEVEEPDVLGVHLDELASQVHVLAHQDRADLVGQRRLLHPDLQQRAAAGVHGGVPELAEVHLAEALE